MNVITMAINIIDILYEKYRPYIKDSIDMKRICDICSLYQSNNKEKHEKIDLSDIDVISPHFSNNIQSDNIIKIIKSPEFYKKFSFFVQTIYACLSIDVEIFDTSDDVYVLRNNHQLVQELLKKKKGLIAHQIAVLREQYRNINSVFPNDYESHMREQMQIIRIIDKITGYINRLVNSDVFKKNDNLLSLIVPYFYTKIKIIESYKI